MLVWFVLLGVSIIGILVLLLLKTLWPNFSVGNEVSNESLQREIQNAKNRALRRTKHLGKGLGKTALVTYNKSASLVKETKLSNFVLGKGELKKKEMSSSFLKDMKETRDKVREEFVEEDKPID